LPTFAVIISQLVMMPVLDHCIWQNRPAADKAFFGLLRVVLADFFAWKTYCEWTVLPGIVANC